MEHKYAQFTLKNGTIIQISVKHTKDYRELKSKIINAKKEFVNLIEECTVKADEVVLMELRTYTPEEEPTNED